MLKNDLKIEIHIRKYKISIYCILLFIFLLHALNSPKIF